MKKLLLFFSLFYFSIAQAQVLTDTGQIRSYVNANIVTNGTKAITAVSLNKILNGYLNAWPSSGINTINATGPLSWNAGTKTLSITGYNAANWNTVYNWYVAGGGGGSSVTGTKSINISSGVAQLQNDILSPGPGKVYGTDGSGIRGWYLPPAPSLTGTKSINYSAGTIQLVNDATSPGNTKIYGTDASGIKGWYDAPTGGTGTPATVQNFQTVSSLKASTFNTTSGSLVANVFDLGGASYKWNPTSTSSDDAGVTTIAVTGVATGRWEKIFKGRIRAAEVGLKTDGTDQTSLLLTLASNSSAKEIQFDAGDYTVNGTVDLSNNKTVFQNAARIIGTGTITFNSAIDAPIDRQIFGTGLTIKGLRDKISLIWFGGNADFTIGGLYTQTKTDNLLPFNRAKAAAVINYASTTGYIYASKIVIPAPTTTTKAYYFSDSWNIDTKIEVSGTNQDLSIMVFPQGKPGIILPFTNAAKFGQGSYLHDFSIFGSINGNNTNIFDSATHGISVNSPFNIIEKVGIFGFNGQGILIRGNFSGEGTNAFLTTVRKNRIRNNSGDGIRVEGADCGLTDISENDIYGNGTYAIRDKGTIGIYVHNNHADANGTENAFQRSWVKHGGREYLCYKDGALNIEPGVTSGWQSYWFDWRAATTFPPDWATGINYMAGGSYRIDDANNTGTWIQNYMENSQDVGVNNSPSLIVGGGWRPRGSNGYIGSDVDGAITTAALKASQPGDDGVHPVLRTSISSGSGGAVLGWQDTHYGGGSLTGFKMLSEADFSMLRFIVDGADNSGLHIGIRGSTLASWQGRTTAVPGSLLAYGVWLGIDGNAYANNRMLGFTILTSPPSSGDYGIGDYLKYVGSDTTSGLLGFRCVSRSPLTWFTEKTATGGGGSYSLPIASSSVLGGFKVGSGLAIDGSGVLSTTGGGGSTSPGGSNTQVQFNNGGSFGGSSNLVWNGNQLDIDGTSNPGMRFFNGGTGGWYLYNGSGSAGNLGFYGIAAGKDIFVLHGNGDINVGGDNSNPIIRVFDASGKVGIGFGNTVPTNILDVNGTFGASGNAVLGGSLTIAAPSTSAGSYDVLTRNSSTGVVEKIASVTTTSGTYTPTLTNNANIASSTPYTCHYMRVGNEVTVSGKVGITPTAGSTTTQLIFDLPISTANFTAQEQAGGTGYFQNGAINGTAKIQANPSNQTVSLIFYSNGTGLADFSFTFQYTIQ